MNLVPSPLLYTILSRVNYDTLKKLRLSSNQINRIYSDNYLWQLRIAYEFKMGSVPSIPNAFREYIKTRKRTNDLISFAFVRVNTISRFGDLHSTQNIFEKEIDNLLKESIQPINRFHLTTMLKVVALSGNTKVFLYIWTKIYLISLHREDFRVYLIDQLKDLVKRLETTEKYIGKEIDYSEMIHLLNDIIKEES